MENSIPHKDDVTPGADSTSARDDSTLRIENSDTSSQGSTLHQVTGHTFLPIPQHVKSFRSVDENTNSEAQHKKVSIFNFLLGLLGELLITAGVLIGLFVVWQLWWTDIEAAGQQKVLLSEVAEQLPALTPPDLTTGKNKVGQVHPGTEAPPIADVSKNTGQTMGVMWIPAFGNNYKVAMLQGVDLHKVLGTGSMGHYKNTQLPGEIGNTAFAGHRQSHGSPLLEVDRIKEGDSIIVETSKAWLVYKVTSYEIVEPTKVEVINPVPGKVGATPSERILTLTTCHPLYSMAERYIVYAKLDHWTLRSDGVPPELENNKAVQ